jgi:hypothetical protein
MEKGTLSLEPGKDKRRHRRLALELPVRYKVLNRKLALELFEPGPPERDARSLNLSQGGLCLATSSALGKGDYLKLEVSLKGGLPPVRAMAEVVWSSSPAQGACRAGIRFLILLSDPDRLELEGFLKSVKGRRRV